MKKSVKKPQKEDSLSWKQLISFYTKVKIPWVFIILATALSILMKQVEVWMVPYSSKIMTGAIQGSGFLGGFIFMTIAYTAVEAVQGGINELGGVITTRNVSHTIWGKLLNLPMPFFRKRDPQSLVSRITQDTTGVYAAVTVVVQLIAVLYGMWSAFEQMYRVYKELTFIMLSAIPITFLTSWIVGKLQYKMVTITNTAMAAITNFFGERLPNVMHIKTSNMEDEEYLLGVQANNARFKAELKQERLFIVSSPISSFAMYFNQIVLLVVASALVRAGVMKMYQLVALYNYSLVFLGNAMMISAVWQGIKKSHGACATIAKIVDEPMEDLESGEEVSKEPQNISFRNVSFSYDGENKVLDGASFTIPAGRCTAIVGENGSGKSTVIKLLERFEEPSEGAVCLGDRDLRQLKLSDWRSSLGYLFQGEQLIKGSIEENITYGLHREYTPQELEEAARGANALDFIHSKEEGFGTQVSRFDAKVSGGEMQRLAAARILLRRPDYLIMDEATSAMDTVNAAQVLKNIRTAMEGKTVIMVSHDMEAIRQADHVVVLNEGRVEASGTLEEAMAQSPLLRSFAQTEGATV